MGSSNHLPRGPQLELAGALSVAFVNTVGASDNNRQLGIKSYSELLTWSEQAGVISPLDTERLRGQAAERPEDAATAYKRATALRSNLFALFCALAMKESLPEKDLAAMNTALAAALPALRMVRAERGVTWGWGGDEDALDRMLWPVLWQAAELLISAKGRSHVRQCAFKGCLLFLVDRSPSGQRRWCDMKTCGNRAKAQRHHRRRRVRRFWSRHPGRPRRANRLTLQPSHGMRASNPLGRQDSAVLSYLPYFETHGSEVTEISN